MRYVIRGLGLGLMFGTLLGLMLGTLLGGVVVHSSVDFVLVAFGALLFLGSL